MSQDWAGVFPAVTTKFTPDHDLDEAATARHIEFQLDAGVHGVIVSGSLGEASTLSPDEKVRLVGLATAATAGRVPVLAGVAERTTADACRMAERVAKAGASGMMLLPPMLYTSDRRETMAYLRAVAGATDLPIMIYNNPVAYKVDVTPDMLAELADEKAFIAVKESSDDVRRLTDIVNLVGDRYRLFCGVDNIAMEAMVLGAVGWVAGLVCAFPAETVAIYDLVRAGRIAEARAIYRWFMPLLHLDVSTKLVQNIKMVEAMVGVGSEHVRPPRLPLAGAERRHVEAVVRAALDRRPDLSVLA